MLDMLNNLSAIQCTGIVLVGCLVIVLVGWYLFYGQKSSAAPSRRREASFDGPKGGSAGSRDRFEGKSGELILIHASWCPHCVTFLPTWQKFVSTYSGKLGDITMDDKEISEEGAEELAASLGVGSFPTIMYCPNGRLDPSACVQCNARTPEGILQFLASQ